MPRTKGPLRPGTSALKPAKASALKLHGTQGAGEGSRLELGEDMETWGRARALVKPDDQVDLNENELKEEIARVLTVRTPQQSEGLVIWSHKDAAFVQRAVPASGALLLDMPSTCLHIDSPEAREQAAYLGAAGRITLAETLTMAAKAAPKTFKKESRRSGGGEDDEEEEEADGEGDADGEGEADGEGGEGKERGSVSEGAGDAPVAGADTSSEKPEEDASEGGSKKDAEGVAESGEGAGEAAEEGDEGASAADAEGEDGAVADAATEVFPSRPVKKVANQFNFCDRAALTYNNPYRTLSTQTEPPPRDTFSDQVMQYIIYDAYQKDWEEKQAGKEKEVKQVPKQFGRQAERKLDERTNPDSSLNRSIRAAKTIERMLNQNTSDDIAKGWLAHGLAPLRPSRALEPRLRTRPRTPSRLVLPLLRRRLG